MSLTMMVGAGFLMGAIGMSTALLEKGLKESDIILDVLKRNNIGIQTYNGIIYPEYLYSKGQEWGITNIFTLPSGITSEKVHTLYNALSEALNKDIFISFDKYLYIDVFKERLPDEIDIIESLLTRDDYKVVLGMNIKREPIYYDFNGKFPHLLIGGISGSGKSTITHSILTQLSIKDNPPDLYLADLKFGVELSDYEWFTHVKYFATTLLQLDEMLESVKAEMVWRYNEMRSRGIKKWMGKPIVLLIDEMVDLKKSYADEGEIRKLKAKIKEILAELTGKGRAAKVYCILATQRPDVEVVSGIIKTNVSSTIGFKARDNIQSTIILDHGKAAELPFIPGRSIFQQSDDIIMQTYYLSEEKQKELLKGVSKYERDSEVFEVAGNSFSF